MRDILGKLFALFCIIVFVTFMTNHGHIDYRGIDFVRDKTTEALNSDEGKQYIQETKEISQDIFKNLFYGLKLFFTGESDEPTNPEKTTLDSATLLSCIDGDTILVSINDQTLTVRLIGIDSPESVHPDETKNTIYGDMANEFIENYLINVKTVYLEYDAELEDSYGRTLAYVWLENKMDNPETDMLNAIIIEAGYANDAPYIPNTKYADLFLHLKLDAQQNQIGLWQYPEYIESL